MSACVLQQQTVLTVFQGSSECLLGILSRIQAEKGLSVSKLPMNPSLCAARAWSRTDPKLCRHYKRQVLIDVSASQLCSDISFSTTLCNIRPQCYRTRSDCSSGSPRTIKISRNLEINLNLQWKKNYLLQVYSDISCKGSQRTCRLCKHFCCATVMQTHILEVASCQPASWTDYGGEILL